MTQTTENKRYEVPQVEVKDIVYAAGEALANVLPFAGPELFKQVFSSPLEARRNKWMEEVSKGLLELHNKQRIDINSLAKNEEFISLAIEAAKAALAQHQEEKLQFLRNALLNSLLQEMSYDIKFVFLRAVEQLTPRHIQALKYLSIKVPYNPNMVVSYETLIKGLATNYFDGTEEIAAVFLNDLCQLKLIEKQALRLKRNGFSPDHYYFGSWGEKFMSFISNPDLDDFTES